MDRYPEVKVSENESARENLASSRHDSGSSINKAAMQHSADNASSHHEQASTIATPPQYISFPPASRHSQQRTSSTASSTKSTLNENESKQIDAKYAQYTDAPPPYSEKQYEGKSEEERADMRMSDYAKEISRMMGKQLVRGLKTAQSAKPDEEK